MNVLEARRRLLGAGVYKKTVTGNPAIAQGSLARMYPGIEMQGWTEQDSATGAQLLQPLENTDKNTTTILGVSFTQDNMKFKISGTATGDGGRTTYFAKAILQPGTYYLSISKSVNNLTINISNFSTNLFIHGVGAFEISEITEIGFEFNVTNGTIFDDEVEIMLNAGSTALPWEPYTGGAPSPSPDYPQEIVSAGKHNEDAQKWEYEIEVGGTNLLDASLIPTKTQSGATVTNNGDGSFTVSGEGTLGDDYSNSVRIPYNSEFLTLSVGTIKIITERVLPYFFFQILDASNEILLNLSEEVKTREITKEVLEKMSTVIYGFYGPPNSDIEPGTIRPIVTQAEGVAEWEPYKPPQTVTLTSDRPLTKWDKLEKRNGQWGWEYGSAEIVFDGSDDERWNEYASRNGFNIVISGMLRGVALDGFCDKLIISKVDVMDYPTAVLGSNNNDVYIKQVSSYASDVNAWKTWLQSNPITVLYQLAEPVFVPLSEVEQTQMNALHTNRPTTVLSNDADCEMTLTYKTRKSMEVTT